MRQMMLNVSMLAFVVCFGAAAAAEAPADLVALNALIWTGDPDNPRATALAIRDGRFVAVGGRGDVANLISPDTKVIDAAGGRITPGLIDTHVHLTNAGMDLAQLNLRGAASREALLERVSDHAQTLGPEEWLVGRGWSAESWPDQRPPTAEEIDEAAGGRRAALVRMDGHSLLASSSALEYVNISQESPPDPPGGKIGRLADGSPTGAVYEEAMGILYQAMPGETLQRRRELTRRAVAEANRMGVTQIGAIETQAALENVLAPLDEAGELSLRLRATVTADTNRLDRWRDILEWAAMNRRLTERITVLGFKGYMDGSLGSRTAWKMAPYLDDPQTDDNAGMPLAMAGSGLLRTLILEAAEMGLQPAVHAIGDRANHVLLDWYAEIPDSLREALRPRIEHAQHLLPQDVARFGKLGVVPSMQPYHKADDGRYAEQRLGPERIRTSYAFRDLIDSGAALAFGSDWPVVSVNSFLGMHAAVTARTLDGEVFVPEQSITIEEALRAYTVAAAHCLHSEDDSGVIRVGALGDFALLDRDVLSIDPASIDETTVLVTVVGGVIAHDGRE